MATLVDTNVLPRLQHPEATSRRVSIPSSASIGAYRRLPFHSTTWVAIGARNIFARSNCWIYASAIFFCTGLE